MGKIATLIGLGPLLVTSCPAGPLATLLAPCAAERPMSAEKGGSDELIVALPDLGAWELATVVFAEASR